MAEHSIDFWLQSEDLPRPENRIRYDGDRVVLDIHEGNEEAARRLRAKLEGLLAPMGAWPHLIERRLYLGKDIPIGGTAHQAGTCRFGDRSGQLGAGSRLQGARAGQSVHRGCELLPLDRRGEPDADDHRQCPSGGRPDQGEAGRVKVRSSRPAPLGSGPAAGRRHAAATPIPGRAHPADQPRGVGPRPCRGVLSGRARVPCHCARTLRQGDAGGTRPRQW